MLVKCWHYETNLSLKISPAKKFGTAFTFQFIHTYNITGFLLLCWSKNWGDLRTFEKALSKLVLWGDIKLRRFKQIFRFKLLDFSQKWMSKSLTIIPEYIYSKMNFEKTFQNWGNLRSFEEALSLIHIWRCRRRLRCRSRWSPCH